MVAITINTQQMSKLTKALGHIKNGVPRALAPAINRALSSGQTVVKREIRKEYVIKAKDIPSRVKRANYTSLHGQIVIQDGMLELNKFRYNPKFAPHGKMRRPLFAQVRTKGGGTISRGFVADVGDYSGPFVRKGDARLPIKKLLAISGPIMASQPNVGPAANKRIGDVLDKRIDHEIKRVLASAGGK
jgi:hypothetical protein